MSIYRYTKSPARITGLRRTKKGPSQSHDKLFKSLFEEKDSVIVSSTPKAFAAIHPEDFTENFYISDEELEAYAQGFLDVCTEANIDSILLDQKVEDESLDNIALDDSDIKLSLYRSFKSIYDKWISNSKIGDSNGYFFNQYGQQDDRTLFQHFNFVNRGAADIGGKAVIDIATLSDLTNTSGGKGPTESLYGLTSRILSKNNFDFFALPTYIQYSKFDTQPLADMFKAFPDKINEVTPSPTFLCVYIGGNSRALDIPRSGCDKDNKISFQYKNDSFDISDPTQYPTDISDSQSLTAFKVRYGQEAQNHFTKIELDQQEFKETQESLQVIDALANPKKGGSPTQSGKGNNIYDMYLTRSYSCKVSALGNFQIQPLMYFQLDNVPMFKGTYMITNVTHKITPQKVETEFKGTRQPLVQTPIVVDPISLLDLALSEGTVEGERGNLSSFGGGYDNSTDTYDLNYENKNYPVVAGGKCPNARSKSECSSCLGEEFDNFINGFDTPITFSGQEIKPVKPGSKVSFNKHIKERILPIINSSSYKSTYTKGHRMFAIVWAIKEGYKPGSRSYRTNNPGNIGNTDSGQNREIGTLQEGMDLLMDFIKQASVGNTKYGSGWSFGEKKISPYWSKEIANTPQNYQRVNGCLPGYKGDYKGQLGFFTKRYATFSRVANSSIGKLLTIFELNGKTGLNGNTTIAELIAFNDSTEIRFT